jgi:hypothetical protein
LQRRCGGSAGRPLTPAAAPPSAPCCLVFPIRPQIGQRCLAVGLARELLMHLPEPFQQSTFQQAADAGAAADASGERGAARDVVPAPWSVVCLAALLHR